MTINLLSDEHKFIIKNSQGMVLHNKLDDNIKTCESFMGVKFLKEFIEIVGIKNIKGHYQFKRMV